MKSIPSITGLLNGCLFLAILSAVTSAGPIHISTSDTAVGLDAVSAGISLASLQSPGENFQWIAARSSCEYVTPLISSAIVEGRTIQVHWKHAVNLKPEAPQQNNTFTFSSDNPPLEATSVWSAAKGHGPIEHALCINNRGKKPVLLPLQMTLAISIAPAQDAKPLELWWVEKGAGRPSEVGVHRGQISEDFDQSLNSGPYSSDNPNEPIPWATIYDPQAHRGLYLGVESSARVTIAIRRGKGAGSSCIEIELGLRRDKGYLTRLAPGETLQLPPVFVGCFRGEMDDGCNRLRHWVDQNLRPRAHDPRYPLLVNNSWGNGMNIDEPLCRRMIDSTADLGLEMYHIDAGWFAGVGDWKTNSKKFPRGLTPVADYAHARGLKFGLWVGWTQGGDVHGGKGPSRPMSVFDPTMRDWFPRDAAPNWKPQDFTGMTACLGDPQAADWCLDQLRQIIRDNRLDMLEHDQQMVLDACSRTDHLHTPAHTDVSYRAAQGYYRVYDTLRRENPNLLFEDCVNGGRMVDYGIVRRVHYISITDVYDPLSNRRAFYDASFALPPAMCECYIENHPTRTLDEFKAMLRSGMMGWCTIMTDTTQWTAPQQAAAKKEFALYKSKLRPLIAHGDLYHISARPDGKGWDGIEYWDPQSGRGAVYAFRGSLDEAEHRFILKGLEPDAKYAITSADGGAANSQLPGAVLRDEGLKVHLPQAQTSELVFLQRM